MNQRGKRARQCARFAGARFRQMNAMRADARRQQRDRRRSAGSGRAPVPWRASAPPVRRGAWHRGPARSPGCPWARRAPRPADRAGAHRRSARPGRPNCGTSAALASFARDKDDAMSIPENLAAILARIDAARKAAIKPAPRHQAGRGVQDRGRSRHPRRAGGGPAPVRRKPGAGGAREISAAETRISRPGIASDRAAADQQGASEAVALFDVHPDPGPAETGRCPGGGTRQKRQMPRAVRAGQYRRGTAKGRRAAAEMPPR